MSKNFNYKSSGFISPNDKYLVIEINDDVHSIQNLEGQLLTIIDSVIPPSPVDNRVSAIHQAIHQDQNHAVKSLVRQAVWDYNGNRWCTFLGKEEVKPILEVNSQFKRWQELAGIKNLNN
jgi:hypothetical protein